MKKHISLILVLALLLGIFCVLSACTTDTPDISETVDNNENGNINDDNNGSYSNGIGSSDNNENDDLKNNGNDQNDDLNNNPDNLVVSGSVGLDFRLNREGDSYSVTGIGSCKDTDIIIPNIYNGLPVTKIEDEAFWNSQITSIKLHNGITYIGFDAFHCCNQLKNIDLPDSLETVEGSAFSGCEILDYNLFENGNYLGNESNPYLVYVEPSNQECTSISIHSKTKVIAGDACHGLTDLTELIIGSDVMYINYGAFWGCTNLKDVVIPNKVVSIGARAFKDCPLISNLIIGDNVEVIDNYAFENCEALTSIVIPDSVRTIGYGAFEYCSSLKSIHLGCGVIEIYDSAFLCAEIENLQLPNSIRLLGENAFNHSSHTKYENANYLGNKDNPYMVYVMPATAERFSQTAGFSIHPNAKIIAGGAFNDCKKMAEITLPDGLLGIGKGAFSNTEIQDIIIPNTVEYIGESAFYNCKKLADVVVPNRVDNIADETFAGCKNLVSITLSEETKCIGEYAFKDCSSLKNMTLPNTITYIGDSAFENSGVEIFKIPKSVKYIGYHTFYSCDYLISVQIQNGTICIGTDAFLYCEKMNNIVIPDSVVYINCGSFSHCSNLTEITYDGSMHNWNDVVKHEDWCKYETPLSKINCLDGTIE